MSEEKQFKWQVKPGGTVPADSFEMQHAKSQLGATSQAKSLQINKGGEGAPAVDAEAFAVKSAMNAPRAAQVVNAVDKTQASRHNASGY